MEFSGFVARHATHIIDYQRFQQELQDDPESINSAEMLMGQAIKGLADVAQPLSEGIFTGKGIVGLNFATPWVCETPIPGHDRSVSIRLAHNRRSSSSLRPFDGVVQLKVSDTNKQEPSPHSYHDIATFTTYPSDNRTVVEIDSDSDFGQPGSESWDQLLEILGEAYSELAVGASV